MRAPRRARPTTTRPSGSTWPRARARRWAARSPRPPRSDGGAMSTHARPLPATVVRLYTAGARWAYALQPAFALAVRLYVARVFFLSGLTNLRDWHITVALFTNEYHVPFFMPEVAAALGTTAEVGL